MAELQFGEFNAILPGTEAFRGEPLAFALAKGIGNSSVRDGLSAFAKAGMESPQASQALLRLFAPVEGGPEGKNLWEQVGDAYTRADLRTKHKGDQIATNYFLLQSLADSEQTLHIHGKTRPLTKETLELAKNIFTKYDKYAAKTLDPEDERTVRALNKMGHLAKAAPTAGLAALLAACAAGTQISPPTAELPQPGVTSAEIVIPTPPVTEQAPQGTAVAFENLAETALGASPGIEFSFNELQSIASGGSGTTGEISQADAAVFLENANLYLHNVNALLPSGNPPLDADHLRVFWNGQSGDQARNAPLGFLEQGGDTFVYWLYDKNTGQLSQSPFYNTLGVPQKDLGYKLVKLPDGTTQDNVQVMWNGEAMVVEGASTETLPEVLNLNPSSGEFEQISMDEIAADESIDIFDANTFPEKFRDIANNWLEASDADWALYQEFVESARSAFFSREGVTKQELASITDINENLRSLWEVIYWVQGHREQVIEQSLMPVVTPIELRTILENEPSVNGEGNTYAYSKIIKPFAYNYGIGQYFVGGSYSSQEYGPILGREDVVIPDRHPTFDVSGDVALNTLLFPDDPNVVLTLIHVAAAPNDTNYQHHHTLYPTVSVFKEDYTIQAGALCYAGATGEAPHAKPLSEDYHLGAPYLSGGSRATRNHLLSILGANIGLHYSNNVPVGGDFITTCFEQRSGLQVQATIQDFTNNGQISPPTLTPTEVWPW